MQSRKDYDEAFAVVRETINSWDPHGLIASGCPIDEWDAEVGSIVAQIPRMRGAIDAIHAVSRIFSSSLGSEDFGPDFCEGVGRQLFRALADRGFLD
jgi:hypothetical protein